jgi:branched-chain amino acid transport system ATP-binding protein
MNLLEVSGLRAGFGTNAVLHGVTFAVREGGVSALLGLNGAGKSVTMKTIAGLVPSWSGRITLAGEDITSLAAEARVAAGIGHVPQGRNVFAELTVEQNLRLGGYSMRRRSKAAYKARLDEMLERFPVLDRRRRQAAGTMSGGEQAALAVARGLMSSPRLLLVDEPSAGLAPTVIRVVQETLREVNRSGVTVLLVEQNVAFALELADTVHLMQRGRIVYEGEASTIDKHIVAESLGVGRLLGPGLERLTR